MINKVELQWKFKTASFITSQLLPKWEYVSNDQILPAAGRVYEVILQPLVSRKIAKLNFEIYRRINYALV